MDIHKELEAAGIQIDRHAIELEKPIKRSGKNEVVVRVHPEVTTTLTVNVEAGEGATEEEAE
jgi:large subunit ribosomal protein L9